MNINKPRLWYKISGESSGPWNLEFNAINPTPPKSILSNYSNITSMPKADQIH